MLEEGGGGKGPDGGGAGRIGKVVVCMPELPPAREWPDIADELEVRGGKLGRGCDGSSYGCMPMLPLTSAAS